MPLLSVHTFAISASAAERTFTGFVDMMRYDSARVVEGDGSLIILQAESPPTEARWASFGLHLLSRAETRLGEPAPTRDLREEAASRLPLPPIRRPRAVERIIEGS